MTEKETLLAAFDDAWMHKWESFSRVTIDLTDAEVLYQHPVYADAEQEEGWPKAGSIMWHLVHMEYWYRYYLDTLERIPEPARNHPPVRPVSILSEALSNLEITRSELRAKIASLSDDTFAVQLRGIKVGEFVRMIIRHDSWHSAQIALARRLYNARN